MEDTALLQLPDVLNSSDKFAVFTQVARLLAAEDIIVRWNVRGMDCPASMNYASRVLSVAPVKAEHEDMIPGLILHEVGHFIFSKKAERNASGSITNLEALEQFREKIKHHRIWNIIEDGYVERRVVAKWPGALKHLRVLYDHDKVPHDLAQKAGTMRFFLGGVVDEIISTLHLNVLGVKWGDKFSYPPALPAKLLALLEQARCTMADEDGRAELSSQIVDELAELQKVEAELAKKMFSALPPPAVQPTATAAEATDDDGDDDDAADEATIAAPTAVSDKTEKLSAKEKAKIEAETEAFVKQLNAQADVDSALEARTPKQPALAEDATPDDADADGSVNEHTVPVKSAPTAKGSEKVEDDDADQESSDAQPEDEEADPAFDFEQFISDAKAKIIGNNMPRFADIMAEQVVQESVQHVPSPVQVTEFSDTRDIIHEKFQTNLKTVPFYKFISTLLKQESKPTLKAASTYNDKVLKARVIAQQMFQRFTTKANAQNVALTKRRLTGRLDPTRASLFKIYDDVFERRQVAPNQVNHSYTVMVDWSGSMRESAMELFHRVSELTFFAQLANVELDIWLYTTGGSGRVENAVVEETTIGQEGLLVTSSVFIQVLNTKKHAENDISYRLFALFLNACANKSNKHYATSYINGSPALFGGKWMTDYCIHSMGGTNIFEALSFASERAKLSTAQRRSVLIVTDGEDCAFGSVMLTKAQKEAKFNAYPVHDANEQRQSASRVMYGTVNILELGKNIQAAANQDSRSLRAYTPLSNIKTLATALLNENLRRAGIAVTAVTWGNYMSSTLMAWTRDKVIRVKVPTKDLQSSNISRYTPVNNEFITLITEALLANIGATTDVMLSGR